METSWLKRTIPILSWLPAYDRGWLTPDTIAGLTVWGLIVPQSMAFTLVVGVVFLIAGLARLGWITQFLSKPVLDGFVTGLAVFVMVGQLYKLFGVPKPAGNTVQKFFETLRKLPEANWVTFAVGADALALLILLPRRNKKIPSGLIVLFGSIALRAALNLNANYGVEVVGVLPQGLPSFSLPSVSWEVLPLMIAQAIGVLLVSFSQSLGVAQNYADRHDYEINANQELNSFAHAISQPAYSVGKLRAAVWRLRPWTTTPAGALK